MAVESFERLYRCFCEYTDTMPAKEDENMHTVSHTAFLPPHAPAAHAPAALLLAELPSAPPPPFASVLLPFSYSPCPVFNRGGREREGGLRLQRVTEACVEVCVERKRIGAGAVRERGSGGGEEGE